MSIELDGRRLTIAELAEVARSPVPVRLSAAAAARVAEAHRQLGRMRAAGAPIYGLTTGVGALERDRTAEVSEHERNAALLRSHAGGIGPAMGDGEVRAMMVARASTLAAGMSGVSPAVLDALVALVGRGVCPVVPELGSVGASDLAPLAHMALVLIGEGRARVAGAELPAAEALARAGLAPAVLVGRDGLALINGLAQSAALGALAAADAATLIETAEAAAAMTLSALGAPRDFLDPKLADAKRHPGQRVSAAAMRGLLGDAIARYPGRAGYDDRPGPLRAPLSLRYAPQVTGAARSAHAFAAAAVEAELDAVADNPLLFPDGSHSSNSATTGGDELAQALDFLAIAIASLAVTSERRTAALLDGSALPLALRHPRARAGIDSGLLIAQYSAAALVAELRARAVPASLQSIPTCPGEDHVSMSALAARHARTAVDRARTVVAIELLCACQAVDLAGVSLSAPLAALHARVRDRVPVLIEDRILADDIAATIAALEDDPPSRLRPLPAAAARPDRRLEGSSAP